MQPMARGAFDKLPKPTVACGLEPPRFSERFTIWAVKPQPCAGDHPFRLGTPKPTVPFPNLAVTASNA